MEIIFTKTSLTHHTLKIIRADRTTDFIELETKTFMPHDLIHYAFESLAGLQNSFWGLLAQGRSLHELDDISILKNDPTEEISITEMITGALTGFLKNSEGTSRSFLENIENMCSARNTQRIPNSLFQHRLGRYVNQEIHIRFSLVGIKVPAYLSEIFLENFREEMRKLLGHWHALGKDQSMRLIWK